MRNFAVIFQEHSYAERRNENLYECRDEEVKKHPSRMSVYMSIGMSEVKNNLKI